ncbi:MAG: hypothetical protein Q8L29_00195 [archaeon]|nr:hypothetical protein [archaeon]
MIVTPNETLVDKIKRTFDIEHVRNIIPYDVAKKLDFQGKDALREERLREALILKAQSAVFYFQNNCFKEAAKSAENAAGISFSIKARERYHYDSFNYDELNKIMSEAYLNEFRGNCSILIRDYKTAFIAYLEAAKSYIEYQGNESKARKLKRKCGELNWKFKLKSGDRNATRLYKEVTYRINKFSKVQTAK